VPSRIADAALAAIVRSTRYAADSPQFYADEGEFEIRRSNFDRGQELLLLSIETNPEDAGQTYDPSPGKELTDKAIKHGKEQVRRMLRDRPVMLNHLDENDVLSRWAALKFAGEDTGCTIDWDPTVPVAGTFAEHAIPTDKQRGLIRIAKTHGEGVYQGIDLTFEELWMAAVFELNNISNAKAFRKHYQQAWNGKLTRDEFVRACCLTEMKAMQQTRAFYCSVYLPWIRQKRIRTEPQLWYTGPSWWGTREECFATYPKESDYPWGIYGKYFEQLRTADSPLIESP
jgi:hypothetical protein